MENKIEIFKNEELGEVRSLLINGEPWFVGKDVAEALGYKDTSDALKVHVDEEDKGVGEMPTPGGKQNMITINESGLYDLIFGSKLENSKKFKRWVTKDVLPSIRKHGMYIAEELLKDKQKLESELDQYMQRYEQLEYEKKLVESKNEEIEEEVVEFRKQRQAIFGLSVKTGQDESYLPDLALQVIREYVLNNEEVVIEAKESGYKVKRRPLVKELSKLILRKQDIIYILGMLRINIEDDYMFIRQEFMDNNYKPIGSLYL